MARPINARRCLTWRLASIESITLGGDLGDAIDKGSRCLVRVWTSDGRSKSPDSGRRSIHTGPDGLDVGAYQPADGLRGARRDGAERLAAVSLLAHRLPAGRALGGWHDLPLGAGAFRGVRHPGDDITRASETTDIAPLGAFYRDVVLPTGASSTCS
jgi:hypothetical protein